MKFFFKLLLLVFLLNIIRYLFGFPFEYFFVMEGMHGVMPEYPNCFQTDFTGVDFGSSFFYNFMMWLLAAWMFVLAYPALKGSYIVRSLKVFSIMGLFFISLAAIYMNHYTIPIRTFYLYSMLDAIFLFPIVSIGNGILFPLLFKKEIITRGDN